jgi:protein subunit release factor A
MVPGNEKQGKMQTGTAVVVAMPEASEVRVQGAGRRWIGVSSI